MVAWCRLMLWLMSCLFHDVARAILPWGHACVMFKDGGEVLAGGEIQCVCDARDGPIWLGGEPVFGLFETTACDVGVGRLADFFGKACAKLTDAKLGECGEFVDGQGFIQMSVDPLHHCFDTAGSAGALFVLVLFMQLTKAKDINEQIVESSLHGEF